MQHLGWASLIQKIGHEGADQLQAVQRAIFRDLQRHKQADGIHFDKVVFFVYGIR